jgi:hypothetical protein
MCFAIDDLLQGRQRSLDAMNDSCKGLRPDSGAGAGFACLIGMAS